LWLDRTAWASSQCRQPLYFAICANAALTLHSLSLAVCGRQSRDFTAGAVAYMTLLTYEAAALDVRREHRRIVY